MLVAVATVSFRPRGFTTFPAKRRLAVCAGELESSTLTEKLYEPSVVGVPLIWPPLGSTVLNPAGGLPDPIEKW
jgi:hypothetical protein